MKKLYMLLMATLIVATAGAQTAISQVKVPADKKMVAPLKQLPTDMNLRGGGPNALLLRYDLWDLYAFLPNATTQDLTLGGIYYLQNDTLGLVQYGSASTGYHYDHPFVYSFSQTYDFNSFFYDEFLGEGEMSLTSSTLNLDTLIFLYDYTREEQMDPNVFDTLLVSFVFDNNPTEEAFQAQYPNTCYYNFDFDVNTGVQTNPTAVFRIPLGPEDVCTDTTYSRVILPVGLTNITANAWHVAITFKRGYEIGMNENLPSYASIYVMTSADPDYALEKEDGSISDDPYRCDNKSHGGIVWDALVNYYTSHNVAPFYYPTFDGDAHFLYGLYLMISCDDCEIVNVPEIEKNNPTIYPNPATNNFTVNLGNDEKANIQLFNIVGQQVMSETITGTAQVNVANLNSGVYMLKINQNGKVYTTKVIVK